MTTGEKIKYYRTIKGLTQTELGNLLGVQSSAIAKYEKGRVVNIKRATLSKMAKIFEVTIVDLLDDDSMSLKKPVYEASAGEGRIGDGSPSEEYAIRMNADECLVRVKGKSMQPTLMDNDLVVISAQSVLEYPRQMCLVKINGDESTIKRVEQKPNGLLLIGDNIDVYEPHFYTDDEVVNLPVTIEGVVVKIIRDVR